MDVMIKMSKLCFGCGKDKPICIINRYNTDVVFCVGCAVNEIDGGVICDGMKWKQIKGILINKNFAYQYCATVIYVSILRSDRYT